MQQPTPLPLPSWTPAKWDERVYPAGDWVQQEADSSRMVMGKADQIVWSKGEPFFVIGDTGYGKSAYLQNVVKVSIGLQASLVGFEVRLFQRILYIAADRPSQIKYSMARMVDDNNRGIWNEHVFVHEGPLDFSINERPELLVAYAQHPRDAWGGLGCDCLIIDSLKDIATGVTDDEEGMKINAALQAVCRAGIELAASHHPRKTAAGQRPGKQGPVRPTLDDIFGSKFIPAGAGSVLFIHDKDELDSVRVTQVKSPAGEVMHPPLRFDAATGEARWTMG